MSRPTRIDFFTTLCAGLALWPAAQHASEGPGKADLAYIGPGAGFTFLGSFLALVSGFLMGVLSLLTWPFRMAWRAARRRRMFRKAQIRKLIFLGLDGLDPRLVERFLTEQKENCRTSRDYGSEAASGPCAPLILPYRPSLGPRSRPA